MFDLISSQRTRITTLIAARFEDTFTAARLFEGSCKANDFNDWLAEQLCPCTAIENLGHSLKQDCDTIAIELKGAFRWQNVEDLPLNLRRKWL